MNLRFWRKKPAEAAEPSAVGIHSVQVSDRVPTASPPGPTYSPPIYSPPVTPAPSDVVQKPAESAATPTGAPDASSLRGVRAIANSQPSVGLDALPLHHSKAPSDEVDLLARRTAVVIGIWERAQNHQLSPERAQEFQKREEMAALIEIDRDELALTAQLAMKQKRGRLLLADWLAFATERRVIHEKRAARQADIAEVRRRCPGCDMYEKFCICN